MNLAREEILIQTEKVRVRALALAPADATPWHFHREVVDQMVGLTGRIIVELKEPHQTFALRPGQRCRVEVGRVHRVVNSSRTQTASYLLIQGVGRYDFNVVEPSDGSPDSHAFH